MWSYFLSLITCNLKFILMSIKKKTRTKAGSTIYKHTLFESGTNAICINETHVYACLDHPSPALHSLNIALFSPIPLPSSSLLLCSPPPMHPALLPLLQVFPGPSTISEFLFKSQLFRHPRDSSESLPTSNMLNLPPNPFPFLLPTAEKLTFTLFPSHSLN